ncbi:MAG: 3'-5' exonuclease [Nitrospirota bacterium]
MSKRPYNNNEKGNQKAHRYVVLDLETTGLSPTCGARVIEIGAIAIESGSAVEEFHAFINPGTHVPLIVQQIHGITDEMLKGKPRPDEVMPRFCNFMRGSVLIAHNAHFDLRFLRYEFSRLNLAFNNNYICTLQMSRRHCPSLPNHRLETVYRYLCGEFPEGLRRHRALGDARLTAGVWMALREET